MNKLVSELPDSEQIKMLQGIFEHSDFTKRNHAIWALKNAIDCATEKAGRFSVEDALLMIKNRREVADLALLYDPLPYWLIDLMRGLLTNHYDLRLNKKGPPAWTKGIDVLGIEQELVGRFGFDSKLVRQFIADALNVPGNSSETPTYNCNSSAEDAVRKYLERQRDN